MQTFTREQVDIELLKQQHSEFNQRLIEARTDFKDSLLESRTEFKAEFREHRADSKSQFYVLIALIMGIYASMVIPALISNIKSATTIQALIPQNNAIKAPTNNDLQKDRESPYP